MAKVQRHLAQRLDRRLTLPVGLGELDRTRGKPDLNDRHDRDECR
jgi:hypothetical protein